MPLIWQNAYIYSDYRTKTPPSTTHHDISYPQPKTVTNCYKVPDSLFPPQMALWVCRIVSLHDTPCIKEYAEPLYIVLINPRTVCCYVCGSRVSPTGTESSFYDDKEEWLKARAKKIYCRADELDEVPISDCHWTQFLRVSESVLFSPDAAQISYL